MPPPTSSVIYASIQSDGTVGQWAYTTSLPKSLQLQGAVANYLYVMGGSTSTTAEPGNETTSLTAKLNPDETLDPSTSGTFR